MGLQKVQEYFQFRSLERLILSFQDSEALEGKFLSDLIRILRSPDTFRRFSLKLTFSRSWSDRIPFVLLFGISTSIEIFKDKLSLDISSRLRSVEFGTDCVDSEQIFQATISPKISCPWLGPNISRAIFQRGDDQAKGISYFSQALKASCP